MMKCQYVIEKFKSIEDAINKAKNSSVNDPELSSMLSSYLVVLISGIYEDCIEQLFIQRAAKAHDKELESLVANLINWCFKTPNYKNIKNLISYLEPSYINGFDSKIDVRHREAINSIVDNKNCVAHGKISNATLNDISIYHANALKVFEELENILL